MNNIFLSNSPHKRRPFFIHPLTLFIYILVILSIIFAIRSFLRQNPDILGYATNINTSELLRLTNKIREEKGLDDLKLNAKLSKAAELKAQDMFKEDYWAHTSPKGTEPWDFIKSQGYYYVYAGENLAVDFSDSDDVVKGWYNSPSHRDNLLNKNYTEIGFAVVNGELQGRKTTLVVQMFGMPRIAPPKTASVQNTEPPIQDNVEVAAESPEQLVVTETPQNEVPETIAMSEPENFSPIEVSAGAVLNASDVFNVSRFIAIILGIFVTALFAVDGYYIRKLGINRLTGHTILHVLLLALVIIGIWYTNIGLVL